jgi:hypothetical protein
MIQLLRSLFKKPKPKKIIEIIESSVESNKKMIHHFNNTNENNYCSILEYVNSSIGDGFQTIKIAWRNPKRIKVGDLIILNNKNSRKTLRLIKILNDNGDVKFGIANMLK